MEKQASRSLGMTLNYKNPIQAFFANGHASYLHHRNPYLREQFYQGDYIVVGYLLQATESETFQVGGKLSKGMDWWELVGTLSVAYSDSHSRMQQNGILQPYRSDFLQAKLDLTSRPAKWMSWEYQLACSRDRLKSDTYESSANHLKQQLSLSFRPDKYWRFSFSGEHYLHAIEGDYTKNFILLDADLCYQISSQCEIACRLSNLLNEKYYAYSTLGDLTRTYSEYRIRPFNAVVEVYVKF